MMCDERSRGERMIYGNVQHICVLLVLCIIRDFYCAQIASSQKITFEKSMKNPPYVGVDVDVREKYGFSQVFFAKTEDSISDVCQLGQDVCFNNSGINLFLQFRCHR